MISPHSDNDRTFLRPATANDVPALIDIARRAWLCAYYELAPIEAIRDWVADDFEGKWYPTHWPEMTVAAIADQPVGLVQPEKDSISGLWVHPKFHRRGIGSHLLRSGEDEIRKMGYQRVHLCCGYWNSVAPEFYRSQGYKQVGVEKEVLPSGIEQKLIVFERMLE